MNDSVCYHPKYDHYYSTTLHLITVVEIPLHCFGAFLILFQTPVQMKSVKLNLFLMHITCASVDLSISFLTIPVLFIPAQMGYPLGVLSMIGFPIHLQTYIVYTSIAISGCAIIATFENRFYRVVKNCDTGILDSKFRTILTSINILLAYTFILPALLTSPEPEEAINYFKHDLPCIPTEVYQRKDFFVVNLDWKIVAFPIAFISVFIASQGLTYLISTTIFLFSTKSYTSKATLLIQKRFFVAICLQLAVLLIWLLFPICYVVFAAVFYHFDLAVNLICFVFICLHGCVSTILMILVHKPYRTATLQIFKRVFFKPMLQPIVLRNLSVSATTY